MNLKRVVFDRTDTNETFEEFERKTMDYTFTPFEMNGNVVAIVIHYLNEIHVVTTPEYQGRGLSRSLFRKFLGDMARKYGVVMTQIENGHKSGERLAKWLGFEKFTENKGISYYMLDNSSKWVRES